MATYLIDCGPSGDLLELGRRVVSYLGPDAVLGRSNDLVYGGIDARSSGAEVFIGIQASGAQGTETWVHPRGGPRSRALAESIQTEMVRFGARGNTRTGDLSVLAPERHLPSAAACVIEVDDRVRLARDAHTSDTMAQAIAAAARSARFGRGSARTARVFEVPAGADALMRPFADLIERARTDSGYRERVLADPLAALREAGVMVPAEVGEGVSSQIRNALTGQVSTGQSWSRGLEAASADVHAEVYGVVIDLNAQATSDLNNAANGVAGVLAVISAACGGTGNVPCSAIAGILAGYLAIMSSVIGLMNRGNGVRLTIPWTSFLPLMPSIVIPTPR